MSSAKNTVVAILLLGVSYGVYQVINAPVGSDPLSGLMQFTSSGELKGIAEEGPVAPQPDAWNAAQRPTPPKLPEAENVLVSQPNSGATGTPANSGFQGLIPAPSAPPPMQPSTTALAERAESPAKPLLLPPLAPAGGNPGTAPGMATGSSPGSAAAVSELAPISRDPPATLAAAGEASRFNFPAAQPPGTTLPVATVTPKKENESYTATSPEPLGSVWPVVTQMARDGNLRGALQRLTPYHELVPTSDAERSKLDEWLDALAAKVVYSTEHHMQGKAHVVQAGETLDTLAAAWRVPAKLIYNVNGDRIRDPLSLPPGTELKIVEGPFLAVVSPARGELTLYTGGMYAGRFPLQGNPAGLPVGNRMVKSRLAAGHPCGACCLELDRDGIVVCATGAPNPGDRAILLSPADAEELYGILAVSSEIVIR